MRKLFVMGLLAVIASVSASAMDDSRLVRDHYLSLHPIETWKYDWTTAIYLFATIQNEDPAIRDEIFAHLAKKIPHEITMPDLAAISLPAALVLGDSKQGDARSIIEATKRYFATEHLNKGGVFDHVGRRHRFAWFLPPTSWLVPSSVWTDSSVMYALNGFLIATVDRDEKQRHFFVDQLLKIHKLLWHEDAKLYKHAYVFRSKSWEPHEGYWARGNAWMILAELGVLEHLDANDPDRGALLSVFTEASNSLVNHIEQGRGLRTILMPKDDGEGNFETTASALLSHVLMKGARLGLLSPELGEKGRALAKELKATVVDLQTGSVSGISCPTTAIPWKFYYTHLVGECRDESYGVGAVIMMLNELERP